MTLNLGPKGKPWPGYFIVRPNGEIVPLIAVDELPLGTDLLNIPRRLALEATIGMLNLGLQRSSGLYYQLSQETARISSLGGTGKQTIKAESSTIPKSTTKQTPRRFSSLSETSSTSTLTPPSTPRLPLAFPNHHSPQDQPTSSSTTTTTTTKTLPPTFTSPQNNTTLCRHWCTHGICKWGQQCRYRHIMPMTMHGLQEVGLRDWPKWYRELNPGYFVAQGNAAAGGNASRAVGRGVGKGKARERDGKCGGGGGDGVRDREREKSKSFRSSVVARGGGGRERGAGGGGGGVGKSEELGEQILKRLRGMERDGKVVVGGNGSGSGSGSNAVIEKAASKDVRNWEDEDNSDVDEGDGEVDVVGPKQKLVDV